MASHLSLVSLVWFPVSPGWISCLPDSSQSSYLSTGTPIFYFLPFAKRPSAFGWQVMFLHSIQEIISIGRGWWGLDLTVRPSLLSLARFWDSVKLPQSSLSTEIFLPPVFRYRVPLYPLAPLAWCSAGLLYSENPEWDYVVSHLRKYNLRNGYLICHPFHAESHKFLLGEIVFTYQGLKIFLTTRS